MNLEISTWLASARDYAAGVALYDNHGPSGLLKRLLAGSTTSYTREVLARELAKLVASAPAATNPQPITNTQPLPSPAPDVVQQLRQARRPLLGEREYLHARLELLGEAARGEAALRILAIGEELHASYAAETHYAKYGTLPEAPPPAVVTPELATLTDNGEIRRLLALARAQRSKLKDRPNRAADYAQVVANIDLLEAKLLP